LTNGQAKRLYQARWGKEVFYRSYKQTLQRRKLLSRTAPTCLVEGVLPVAMIRGTVSNPSSHKPSKVHWLLLIPEAAGTA
jgi:hypothetical protein